MPAPLFSVTISSKAAKSVGAGAYWLSEKDVCGWKTTVAGIARVCDKRGNFVAMAFASPHSRYFLRIITVKDEAISRDFWRSRIRKAFAKRRALLADTNAVRVVYSEADEMPSVIIDLFNDVAAIQITSAGAESAKEDIIGALIDELNPVSVIEKNDCAQRLLEELSTADKIAFGEKTKAEVFELDQKFDVDVIQGQKTGAYLDYRSIRFAARRLANGRALDLCCYQGWISCHIASACDKIIAVDASKETISFAQRNANRNGHQNITFTAADALDFIKNCKEKFDFIHIDPPAMAKKHADLNPALAAYKKLVSFAARAANDGAIFMISSCSHRISERILEETVLSAINKSRRKCEIIWRGIQDKDHPVAKRLPESLYLKAVAVKLHLSSL